MRATRPSALLLSAMLLALASSPAWPAAKLLVDLSDDEIAITTGFTGTETLPTTVAQKSPSGLLWATSHSKHQRHRHYYDVTAVLLCVNLLIMVDFKWTGEKTEGIQYQCMNVDCGSLQNVAASISMKFL